MRLRTTRTQAGATGRAARFRAATVRGARRLAAVHSVRPTPRGLAGVVLVLAVGTLLAGGAVQVRVDTGTTSFLPAGDPSIAAMDQKARDFGGDPVVVLLHSGQPRALLSEPEQLLGLLKLEGELAKLPDVASVYGPATTLNQLAGAAQGMLSQIAGRRDGARIAAEQQATREGRSPEQVREAGEQAQLKVVMRYAPLLVRGLPAGLPTLHNPRFAGAVIYGEDGEPRPQWRFIAPDAHSVAVLVRPRQDLDQAGTQALVDAIRSRVDQAGLATDEVTVSGVPAVTADLTAEIARELPLLSALAAVIVLVRFSFVPAPGDRRRRWSPLAAVVLGAAATFSVFGWIGHPLSFGAVALLPLLLGIGSSFPLYLAAMRDRRPILVVAAASAAAFAALALSPLPFVRDLGVSLALGVLLTVAAAIALDQVGRRTAPATPAPGPAGATVRGGGTARPGHVVRGTALLAAVALAATGWTVLSRLDIQADPQELAGGLPALESAHTVEQALGSSGEVGLVLRGPDVLSPEAMAWEREARDAVVSGFGDQMRPVIGVSDLFAFLGPDPTPEQVTASMALVPSYLSSAVVRPDRGSAVQVFGVRLQDLGAQTDLLDRVRAQLPPPPAGYSADLVGLPAAAGASYRALLDDRYLVNVAGIVVAGLVLGVGLRRRSDALRGVLAAAVATGWGFALLWALGVALSPLTVGLGALVTVTGCEFVVLFAQARRLSSHRLRRSVVIACVTSAAGYLVLVVSQLRLVREFGLVLGAAVLLSYLAALLVVWIAPPASRGAVTSPPVDGDSGTIPDPVKVDA